MLKSGGARAVTILGTLFAVAVVTLLSILVLRDVQRGSTLRFAAPYQAVMLTNGQVLFGRLEHTGSPFVTLTDVYYVQAQMNQETKQVSNLLVRRGKEWHLPDRTIVYMNNILLIEPVKPDSDLAKRIAELQERKSASSGQN